MLPTESAWPAVILGALIAVILFVRWMSTQQKKLLIGALAGVVIAAGGFLLDWLVVTDREWVEQNLLSLAYAVRDGDEATALSFLSQTPQALECRLIVTGGLAIADIQNDMRITDIRLESIAAGSQITSHFRANATIQGKGPLSVVNGRGPTRWLLTWQREAGDWKVIDITRLQPLSGEPMEPLARRLD